MRVLYCNPSFWEYRLPFYVELNRLFEGDFHVVYSTKRYMHGHTAMLQKIKEQLGDNAHPYDNELMYDVKTRSFHNFSEGHRQIPLPFALWKHISKVKPEVLITEGFSQWTPFVQLWGILHRVPVFMGFERTLYTERSKSLRTRLQRKLQNKFLAGYLVNGSETRKYLNSLGIKDEKIFVGGMSADSKGLTSAIAQMAADDKTAFRQRFVRNGRPGIVYLFSGRVEELKGAPHLLKAWAKHIAHHPDDSLVLIGMGDKYDESKQLYANVPSIYLEGRVNYDDVHKYYAVADVFILPTLTDNWSLVVPEAMSCALPVATSIYNGCHPELVHKDENGFVFDTYKEETLIEALEYFHHVDLQAFGKRSVELEKEFNTENSARREYEGIMTVMNKRKKK